MECFLTTTREIKYKIKFFYFLPGDAHDIRRLVTRLSSDRVIENRSANAENITDDEKMVKDTSQMTTTILHFISYLFSSLSLFAHTSNSLIFFSFSRALSLSLFFLFFCHTFYILSCYFDYNQLKWSCPSHYTT